MNSNELELLLQFTNNIDLIKKINKQDEYIIKNILNYTSNEKIQLSLCNNNIDNVKQEALISKVLDGFNEDCIWKGLNVISDEYILKNRSMHEICTYIDKLNSSNDDMIDNVNFLISNPSVLENITYKDQITAIDNSLKYNINIGSALGKLLYNNKYKLRNNLESCKLLVKFIINNKNKDILYNLNSVLRDFDLENENIKLLNKLFLVSEKEKNNLVAKIINNSNISLMNKNRYIDLIVGDEGNYLEKYITSSKQSSSHNKKDIENQDGDFRIKYYIDQISKKLCSRGYDFIRVKEYTAHLSNINEWEVLRSIYNVCCNDLFFKFRNENNFYMLIPFFEVIYPGANHLDNAEKYLTSPEILEYRNALEQYEILSNLNAVAHDSNFYNDNVLLNKELIKHRSHKEVMMLFDKIKSIKDLEKVKYINNVLELHTITQKSSFDEQKSYIDKIIDASSINKAKYIYEFLSFYNIIETKQYDDNIKIIDKISSAKSDRKAYETCKMFCNLNLNKDNLSVNNQIYIANVINGAETDNIASYIGELIEMDAITNCNLGENNRKYSEAILDKINVANAICDSNSVQDIINLLNKKSKIL